MAARQEAAVTGATGEYDVLNPPAGDAAVIRAVFARLPLIVISPEGPEYRITAPNQASRMLLGRSDLVGLPLMELIPDTVGQRFAELLDRVSGTGQPEAGRGWRIRLTVAAHGLAEVVTDFTVLPWRSADGVAGLIAAGTDAMSARPQEAP